MALDDANLKVHPAPEAEQVDILFDPECYTAFPHVVQLGGRELLIAFRQAPREPVGYTHVHPRSIITVMRSYDNGHWWDAEGATQVGAGGGQELGLLYLGDGVVGGALAKHRVVPRGEGERAGMAASRPTSYPYRLEGGYWVWSDDYGLTWPLCNATCLHANIQPCAPPVRLQDGTLIIPTYGRAVSLATTSSVVHRSEDGGKTWSVPLVMAEGQVETRRYAEPALVELEPGHLRGLHRSENVKVGKPRCFWTNESFDGGQTWTDPVHTGIVSGACPRLLQLYDGRLLLTFGRRVEPFGIRAMLSADGGQSWGATAWVVRKTPDSDQGYTSSIELADGRIFTTSYAKNTAGVTGIVGTYWRLP